MTDSDAELAVTVVEADWMLAELARRLRNPDREVSAVQRRDAAVVLAELAQRLATSAFIDAEIVTDRGLDDIAARSCDRRFPVDGPRL